MNFSPPCQSSMKSESAFTAASWRTCPSDTHYLLYKASHGNFFQNLVLRPQLSIMTKESKEQRETARKKKLKTILSKKMSLADLVCSILSSPWKALLLILGDAVLSWVLKENLWPPVGTLRTHFPCGACLPVHPGDLSWQGLRTLVSAQDWQLLPRNRQWAYKVKLICHLQVRMWASLL